jgi:hypothetical protein
LALSRRTNNNCENCETNLKGSMDEKFWTLSISTQW